jgi:phage terminase small subunit
MTTNILDQQHAFAVAYVMGNGNATQAAIDAGYSPVSARQTASRLLHTSRVQDAIRREQNKSLRTRLATRALAVLEKVMEDDAAPMGVRVDAAKTILDRAGLPAVRVAEPIESLESMSLGEMSLPQLESFIRAGQLRLAVAKGEVIDG